MLKDLNKENILIERESDGTLSMQYNQRIRYDYTDFENTKLVNLVTGEELSYADLVPKYSEKTGDVFLYPFELVGNNRVIQDYNANNWVLSTDSRIGILNIAQQGEKFDRLAKMTGELIKAIVFNHSLSSLNLGRIIEEYNEVIADGRGIPKIEKETILSSETAVKGIPVKK